MIHNHRLDTQDERWRNGYVKQVAAPRPFIGPPKPPPVPFDQWLKKNAKPTRFSDARISKAETGRVHRLATMFIEANPGLPRSEILKRLPSVTKSHLDRLTRNKAIHTKMVSGGPGNISYLVFPGPKPQSE